MFRRALLCAVLVTSVTAAPALASPGHNHNHRHRTMTSWSDQRGDRGDPDDSSDDDSDDSGSDDNTDATTPDTGTASPAGGVVASGPAKTITIRLTGYGAPDNTPAGSKTISMPTIHSQAGGTCTHADPVTFASPGSAGSTEFAKGTIVYFPSLKCYGISEDSGASAPAPHIDIYTGDGPKSVTDSCESALTGQTSVIVNPPANEQVTVGPLSSSSGNCRVGGGHEQADDSG
jgi:hypothetical protein